MAKTTSKQAVFWRKVVKFHDDKGNRIPGTFVLEPLPAGVVEGSKPLCHLCRGPEEGHARKGRVHLFTPMPDPGMTVDVTYPDGQVERRRNVPFGRAANHWWTEKE